MVLEKTIGLLALDLDLEVVVASCSLGVVIVVGEVGIVVDCNCAIECCDRGGHCVVGQVDLAEASTKWRDHASLMKVDCGLLVGSNWKRDGPMNVQGLFLFLS